MEQNRQPEIEPHKYSQLIFDRAAKEMQWRKETFQQMVLEQLDTHMFFWFFLKESEHRTFLPSTKTNWKWITDLNVKC
jgi:hypothetical protein